MVVPRLNKFKKYTKSFELGLQSSLEYRANFFLSLISSIFPMIAQAFLWTTIFLNSKETNILGYDYAHMLTYIFIASIINKLVATGVEWEIASDIKDGGLNKFITRPVGYFPYRVASFLGSKVMQVGVVLIILSFILTVVNYKLGLAISISKIGFFFLSVILALTVNLFLSFTFSAVAFWATESWAVFTFMSLLIQFASGGLFPLDILGENAMKILNVLPFKYIVYFPTNIINNKLSFLEIQQGLLIQVIWLVGLYFCSKLVWNTGMKKYIAVGG